MEFWLRLIQACITFFYYVLVPMNRWLWPRRNDAHRIPPITNAMLLWNLEKVLGKLQQNEVTSCQLVQAYIKRIEEVNPYVFAVCQQQDAVALTAAHEADLLISEHREDIKALFQKYPLLGVPFTVKEAVGVKGFSQKVGSLARDREVCTKDGDVVAILRAAGGIPLLVTNNPEFCFSIETVSIEKGKCLNPYDSSRTAGGSSGGEGALNACGASLFGVGSDIAGSIRIPCMFNGVYGHKPTGGLLPIGGHFPNSSDPDCAKLLQVGPITRFAGDMRLIMEIMTGERLKELMPTAANFDLKDIKIFYAFGFRGQCDTKNLNGLLRQPNSMAVDDAILKAVNYFEDLGLETRKFNLDGHHDTMEIALASIALLRDFPYILSNDDGTQNKFIEALIAFALVLMRRERRFTKEGLLFDIMRRAHGFMKSSKLLDYKIKGELLKEYFENSLGDNGVLIFPTFARSAIPHGTSMLHIWNIDYTLLFNVLELPATHVTLGKDSHGMPVGFQIIAKTYNDFLCLRLAEELEKGLGGWQPPSENRLKAERRGTVEQVSENVALFERRGTF